ncbi:uncharacterized protein BDW70DRAFT_131821 [Aspergillus foveolatus]|uniref:uncharacterized protein n=1 Tax=Aspergillus foveolatus TaxID=210207 RepID=UPI003CCE293F
MLFFCFFFSSFLVLLICAWVDSNKKLVEGCPASTIFLVRTMSGSLRTFTNNNANHPGQTAGAERRGPTLSNGARAFRVRRTQSIYWFRYDVRCLLSGLLDTQLFLDST